MLKKVIQETCYKTTDNACFSSKEETEHYQKKINFVKNIKKLFPEAQKILSMTKNHEELNMSDFDIDELLQKFRLSEDVINIENFEDFLMLVFLYLEMPGLLKFFKFIEKRFSEFR